MSKHLEVAVAAAQEAGSMLRANFGGRPEAMAMEAHDIKLELDVRSQELITRRLLDAFPSHAILGEEGVAGDAASPWQWIVDPIDGTVNYFYGLPHYCVSIALRAEGVLQLGVIYDPMVDELWQVERGGTPLLNGRPIAVSPRDRISETIVSIGFSKNQAGIQAGLPVFEQIVQRVRKCRLLGSAALGMAYVACGRLDAYIESMVSLWDIAAGQLLVETAGGRVELTPLPGGGEKFAVRASSGRVDFFAA